MKHTVTMSLLFMVMVASLAFAQQGDRLVTPPQSAMGAPGMLNVTPATGTAPAEIAGQWAPLEPMPANFGYNTATYLDGALYNFSGLNASVGPTKDCYKMDIASDEWTKIASLPEARLLASSHAVGDKIYVIGGYSTSQPFTTHGQALEYDPATDTFTGKATMQLPVYGAASFVHDGKIWVMGGGTTSFTLQTTVIQIYDPATDTWTVSNSMLPISLAFFDAEVIGDDVYFVGGYRVENSRAYYFQYVYKGAINGTEITWTKLTDLAIGGIYRHSLGTDGSKIYMTGGFTIITQTQGIVPQDTYSYDPATDTWTDEAPKITGISFGSQMLYDGSGKFYVVGGESTVDFEAAVEVYNPTAAASPIAVFDQTEATLWAKSTNTYGTSMVLGNVGTVILQWSAEVDASAPWLTLNNANSGLVEPYQQAAITLAVDPTGLALGEHTGVVTITTNDPEHATLTYTLTLHVQAEDVDEELYVLAEQYTGTWCQFCPFGADSLAAVAARVGDRMVRMAGHDTDPMTIPAWADMQSFIGIPGYPTASINRVKWPGQATIPIDRSDWGNAVSILLDNMRAPVGLTLSDKSYNESTKQYSFTATTFFHQGMEGDIRINAVVTEDDFDFTQKKWTPTGVVDISPYNHTDVVMGIFPDVYGYQLAPGGSFATQNEYTQSFTFTSPHEKSNKAWITIFVHEMVDDRPGRVLQSYQEPLMQGITLDVNDMTAPGSFALRQNYPNPFNPTTTIAFDVPRRARVRLTLHDALGRSLGTLVDGQYDAGTHQIGFDGSELTSGTYYLTMVSGDIVRTRSMTLLK